MPIHLATHNAVYDFFLKMMVKIHPESLKVQDNDGNLPIHLAMLERGDLLLHIASIDDKPSEDTLLMMVGAYPESISNIR